MLSRLKVECGYQFTQKLEGMFNDIKLSDEAMEAYQRHLRKTTVSYHTRVLTGWLIIVFLVTRSCYQCHRYDFNLLAGLSCTDFLQRPSYSHEEQRIVPAVLFV
jgi:hypothetical protein